MPSKNKCTKWGEKHYPPTEKKCVLWQKTGQDNNMNVGMSYDKGISAVLSGSMAPGNSHTSHKSIKQVACSSTVPSGSMGPGNSFV